MRARAETPIDGPVRVQQEDRKRLVLIDQVVVELDALLARDAPEHDEHRFTGPPRLRKTLWQVVIDPELIGFNLLAVVAHLFFTRLLSDRRKTEHGGQSHSDKSYH